MTSLTYNFAQNPHIGPAGTATMHGDAQSSDATPLPGPGAGKWKIDFMNMGGACPTILAGNDGFIHVLSTQVLSGFQALVPKAFLLSPSGEQLSSMILPKGALLGGVYAYVDNRDRLVLVDGNQDLIWISHSRDGRKLTVDRRVLLAGVLKGDQVVSLVPDWNGLVWAATKDGKAITVNPASGAVRMLDLRHTRPHCFKADPTQERVTNSISASPDGVSIISTHAIYMLRAAGDGTPEVVWSHDYERGKARKPGKLAWGSGATPTFFGPNGHDYVMLTDNAWGRENVTVYRAADGSQVGTAGLFTEGASGTENSMIGIGKTVIGASTYGYPYPKYPDGAGPSDPGSALFAPGMERWDIADDGLRSVWRRDDVYSAAVPRYSAADGIIYTCERPRGRFGLLDGRWAKAVAIDMATGRTLHEEWLSRHVNIVLGGGDTLQMVGTIDRNRVWWQGTILGIYRIAPAG